MGYFWWRLLIGRPFNGLISLYFGGGLMLKVICEVVLSMGVGLAWWMNDVLCLTWRREAIKWLE